MAASFVRNHTLLPYRFQTHIVYFLQLFMVRFVTGKEGATMSERRPLFASRETKRRSTIGPDDVGKAAQDVGTLWTGGLQHCEG